MKDPGLKLIDRFITLHRSDCEAFRGGAPAAPAEELSPLCEEDDVRLRRPFDELKRLIGQVAGLLLLAEASTRREVVEAPALMAAIEKLREVSATIEEMRPKLRDPAAVAAFPAITTHIGNAIDSLRAAAQVPAALDTGAALMRIKSAYRMLQKMAEPSRGRSMVDFTQSCCSCHDAEVSIKTKERGR